MNLSGCLLIWFWNKNAFSQGWFYFSGTLTVNAVAHWASCLHVWYDWCTAMIKMYMYWYIINVLLQPMHETSREASDMHIVDMNN